MLDFDISIFQIIYPLLFFSINFRIPTKVHTNSKLCNTLIIKFIEQILQDTHSHLTLQKIYVFLIRVNITSILRI